MTPSELYTLIQSDAQAKALFAAGNDTDCAMRCGAIAPKLRQPVPASIMRKTLAIRGRWGGLQRVANNFESPDPPYQQARTLIDLITAGESIDLDNSAIGDNVPMLIQHNLLTVQDVAEITKLGDVPQTFTAVDVGAARQEGLNNGVT